jgi:hypothetical protein
LGLRPWKLKIFKSLKIFKRYLEDEACGLDLKKNHKAWPAAQKEKKPKKRKSQTFSPGSLYSNTRKREHFMHLLKIFTKTCIKFLKRLY